MLATINLIYSPYLFANIFVRGAIPELMATMILMWILYLIVKRREVSFPVWAVGGLIGLQLMTQTKEIIFPVAACCAGAIPGLPQVELSSGRHNIEFIFEESTVRKAGNFISLGTLIAYAALGVVKVKQKISLYLRRK